MMQRYPIRTIAADELETFAAVPCEAFHETFQPEIWERERQILELDRTVAALDGAQMVGTASSLTFRLTVPGASASAAGITMVSVLPAYRRRGILTAMMHQQMSDALSRGEAIAILFASESGIYSRFGFGLASWHQRLRLNRGEGGLNVGSAAAEQAQPQLRVAEPTELQADLASVYDGVFPGRPGMPARDGRWWDNLLADAPAFRDGMSQLRCLLAHDAGGPRGYALYRTKASWQEGIAAGTLVVRELMSADPAATAALWTDLLSRDLISEVIAPVRPIDDPLLAMLADPRRAHASVSDGLWVRLTDVPAALGQRRYASPVNVVIDVSDDVLPENAGRWRLRSGGPADGGQATCERTTAPANVRLCVQALGAGYLGGAKFGQLAAAGHILELTPGSLASLSTAMSWDPAPWSPRIF
jgi:predicted acetyltransferase